MKKYNKGMVSFVAMMILSPVAAQAADGRVIFNGEVLENTCAAVNKNKIVLLPKVQRSALSSSGATAGIVPFTIDLKNCSPGINVSVYFEKDQFVSTEGRLKNTLSTDDNGAENVDVELLNNQFTPINLATLPTNTKITERGIIPVFNEEIPVATPGEDGSASLPFYARYYATGAAGAGKVTTNVNFTVVYP